jgi:hypothetical protein
MPLRIRREPPAGAPAAQRPCWPQVGLATAAGAPPGAALGRRAPARGHRARAGHAAGLRAGRRAHRQPRPRHRRRTVFELMLELAREHGTAFVSSRTTTRWPRAAHAARPGSDGRGFLQCTCSTPTCTATPPSPTARWPRGAGAARQANGVELWALTDHDEVGGQQRAPRRRAGAGHGLPDRHRDLGQLRRRDGAHRRPGLRPADAGARAGLAATRGGRANARGDGRRRWPRSASGRLRGRAALRRQPRPDLAHALRALPGRDRASARHARGLPPLPHRRQARLRAAPLGQAGRRGALDHAAPAASPSSRTRRATASRRPRSTRCSPSSSPTAAAASRS